MIRSAIVVVCLSVVTVVVTLGKVISAMITALSLAVDTLTLASDNSYGFLLSLITFSTPSIKSLCDVVLKLLPTIPIGLSVCLLMTYFLLANLVFS